MLEFGQMLGIFAAIVLLLAVGGFVNFAVRRFAPRMVPIGPASGETASRLLVFAFGLSALAAILAIVGWIGL